MTQNQFTEEELNAVAEELFERIETVHEEEKALLNQDAPPALSKEVPADPVSQLSPVGQEEVAGELARAQQDPIVPKQMTRQVWKQMMRMHFTVRRGKAQPCGHKLASTLDAEGHVVITSDPRRNCEHCWFTYFNTNGTMTNIADECFRESGRDVLERSRGKKFVKYFLMFMSTIARFQREAAEKAAANGVEIESTGNSGGGDSATDQSIGGVAGEARNIGGINEGSDSVSVGAEDPINEGSVEGLGTGLSGL
jgi:hypothetical protein